MNAHKTMFCSACMELEILHALSSGQEIVQIQFISHLCGVLMIVWYGQAYEYMWELKELFDPEFILNPSVLLNRDPAAHVKHLKPSPPASDIVNRCIECGFCESNCPSRDLSLTPRQRITVYREINRLRDIDNRTAKEDSRCVFPPHG